MPDGKRVDFLTGKLVNDTPEEYVRQNIEKALVRQYKYAAKDCAPEFPIKVTRTQLLLRRLTCAWPADIPLASQANTRPFR